MALVAIAATEIVVPDDPSLPQSWITIWCHVRGFCGSDAVRTETDGVPGYGDSWYEFVYPCEAIISKDSYDGSRTTISSMFERVPSPLDLLALPWFNPETGNSYQTRDEMLSEIFDWVRKVAKGCEDGRKLVGMRLDISERLPERVIEARQAANPMQKARIRAAEQSKNCVICMEDISIGDQLLRMACSHEFHRDCIGQWLNIRPTCPLCRFNTLLNPRFFLS